MHVLRLAPRCCKHLSSKKVLVGKMLVNNTAAFRERFTTRVVYFYRHGITIFTGLVFVCILTCVACIINSYYSQVIVQIGVTDDVSSYRCSEEH